MTVVDHDPGNSALQQLRFWVDTDGDGDYSDEIASITTTAVDDVRPLTQRVEQRSTVALRHVPPCGTPLCQG